MYGIKNTEVFKKGKTGGKDWNSLLGKTITVNTSIGEFNFEVCNIADRNKIKEVYLKDKATGFKLPPIYNSTLLDKDIAKIIANDREIREYVLNIENIKRSSKGICWDENIGNEFVLKYKGHFRKFILDKIKREKPKEVILEFRSFKNNHKRTIYSASFKKGEFRELFRTDTVLSIINKSNYTIDYNSVSDSTKEEINLLAYGTDKKMKFICNNCNKTQSIFMTPRQIFGSGKGVERQCEFCGKIKSKGEFIMGKLLAHLNIPYTKEFGKSHCKWTGVYRYDFYVESHNAIIEVHGMQHYKEDNIWHYRDDGRSNLQIDKIKKELALENGISKYYEIEWDNPSTMFKSIKETGLMSDILIGLNRDLFNEVSSKRYADELNGICEEYKSILNTNGARLSSLSSKFKYSMPTIRKKLKVAKDLGLIEYSEEEIEDLNRTSQRQFEYITVNNLGVEKVFYNIKDINSYYGIGRSLVKTMVKEAKPYKSFSKKYSHFNGFTIERKSVIKES